MRIQDIPAHERPRERAAREGMNALSDAELLAILLRTGSRGKNALERAHVILSHCSGRLQDIWQGSDDFFRACDVGNVQRITVRAALELGHRLHRDVQPPASLEDALFDLTRQLRLLEYEVLALIPLDARNKCIGTPLRIQTGTRSQVQADPKEIIRQAIRRGAHRFVLVHNHPSGECFPSANDILLTKQVIEGAKWVDMEAWDHVILTSNDTFSFREHGLLD